MVGLSTAGLGPQSARSTMSAPSVEIKWKKKKKIIENQSGCEQTKASRESSLRTHIFLLQLLDTGSGVSCKAKRVLVFVLLEYWRWSKRVHQAQWAAQEEKSLTPNSHLKEETRPQPEHLLIFVLKIFRCRWTTTKQSVTWGSQSAHWLLIGNSSVNSSSDWKSDNI